MRPRVRVLAISIPYWGVPLIWLAVMVTSLFDDYRTVLDKPAELIPWAILIAIMNLVPLPAWKSSNLAIDLPIGVAASLILSPSETGIIAFLASIDAKEWQAKISLRKALFNRSQASLAYMTASFVTTGIWRQPFRSPLIVLAALTALATVTVVNYALVGLALATEHGCKLTRVLTRLRLGSATDFIISFFAWGILGAMVALLYIHVHSWMLLAVLAPTLVCRQALLKSQMAMDAKEAYKSRDEAMRRISNQIATERMEERKLIAADLHDEVLQPLFKVTLMAHVLRADIATGRLLALDEDLPELVTAAELASDALRNLIGDLRRPRIGLRGLSDAICTLARIECRHTSISVQCVTEPVTLDQETELVIYQIAKEAIANVIKHSNARNLFVSLRSQGELVVLTVRDDGRGFDPLETIKGHYGLRIMRERAASVGGEVFIDSWPGEGCSVRFVKSVGQYGEPSH